jgi:hypothetical protein
MNKILARNIDSTFWNIELLAVDILKAIEKTGSVVIDFNLEGPAFCETNLYKLFEYLKTKHNVDLSKITIQTANLFEDQSKTYKVEIHLEWMYEYPEIQKVLPRYLPTINKKPDAKKFGLFVVRSNYPRLAIASHMYANYKDDTLMTFHYESSSDYHKIHLGLEELLHKFGTQSNIVSKSFDLIKNSPLLIEKENLYPLNNPECYKILSWYNDFFVEIICESYFKGDTFFPTEKTWRALASKTPFIVQGPTHFLKRLKQLGFKTFDRWWDESYDEDPYDYKLNAILRIIDEVNLLDINKVYNEMQSVLEHNYNVFRDFNRMSFNKLINEK